MPRERMDPQLGVDANGCLTERAEVGGQTVIIHYDDIPECDITTVRGIACTTPLRTAIDIAPDFNPAELADVVRDCLRRELFTVEQAVDRLAQPDMTSRRGAHLLRALLERGVVRTAARAIMRC